MTSIIVPSRLLPSRQRDPLVATSGTVVDRSLVPSMVAFFKAEDYAKSIAHNPADPSNPLIVDTPATVPPLRYQRGEVAAYIHPNEPTGGFRGGSWSNSKMVGNDCTFFSRAILLATSENNWALGWWGGGNDCFRMAPISTGLKVSYIDSSPAQYDSSVATTPAPSQWSLVSIIGRKRGSTIDVWGRINDGRIFKSTPTTGGNGGLRNRSSNLMYVSGPGSSGHIGLIAASVDNIALSDGEMTRRLMEPYYFLREVF